MNSLSVKELRKSFGDTQAVKGISFDVPEGSFFAFLGPNGAGKSTTMSMICSLLKPDSGSIEIFGKPMTDVSVRNDIGVVFQDPMLDNVLTVRENLVLRASMYGISDGEVKSCVDRALAAADATEFADKKYGKLSGGMRRRADIARALVHSPRLLLLDEPTAGLDPQTRKVMWDAIYRLNKENGMTVMLTTHYMEEAAEADDVVIINHGEVVAHGTPAALKETYGRDTMTVLPKDMAEVESVLKSDGIEYRVSKDTIVIPLESTLESVSIINRLEGMMESFEVVTGSMDNVFITITGEEIQ